MKPTVGLTVYYKAFGTPGGEHPSVERLAFITTVNSETDVGLMIVNPTGLYFNISVPQGNKPGQWDWMPFQKGQAQEKDEMITPSL